MQKKPIQYGPEDLADMERSAEVVRSRQALLSGLLPETAKATWLGDAILAGESRPHFIWRLMQEKGDPAEDTYADHLRALYDGRARSTAISRGRDSLRIYTSGPLRRATRRDGTPFSVRLERRKATLPAG